MTPTTSEREDAGRKLYSAHTGNHPTIHCNRFPGWTELSEAEREHWNNLADRIQAALGGGGGRE